MKKTNSGITLLGLIITIIIMLILAGVTISIVGGSDGLLAKAANAVIQTNIAGAKEQAELMIAEITADYYEKKYVDRTTNSGLVDYIKSQMLMGKVTSNGDYFVILAEDGVLTVYEGQDETGDIIVSGIFENDSTINWLENIEVPSDLGLGDTVTYSPSGTYNWKAEYALTNGTTDVTLATGEEVTSGTTDMSLTTWKVFSIDERTGNVELVPSAATTNTVTIHGAQGYNNAVYLLNEACNKLYGNGTTITARSINIDDVEGRMKETALEEAHSFSKNNATWGMQMSSAYTSNKNYPVIYGEEKLSVINNVENNTGLSRSQQSSLIGKTYEGATNGAFTASTSIQPYHNYWKKENSFMQTAFLGDGTGTSNTNYNLILPNGTDTNYWLATRCIDMTMSDKCVFAVCNIDTGYVCARWLYDSSATSYDSISRQVFPVISLNASLITGNDSKGWSIE